MNAPDPRIADRTFTDDLFPSLDLRGDGDEQELYFRGVPLPRTVVSFGGQFVVATARYQQPALKRFAVEVHSLATGIVSVFDMAPSVFRTLMHLSERFSVEDWTFQVRRFGAPRSPRTTYSFVPLRRLAELGEDSTPRLDLRALFTTRVVDLTLLPREVMERVLAERYAQLNPDPNLSRIVLTDIPEANVSVPTPQAWQAALRFAEGHGRHVVVPNGELTDERVRTRRRRSARSSGSLFAYEDD